MAPRYLVNPHDIGIWGDLSVDDPRVYLEEQLVGSTVPTHLFDDRYDASSNEDLVGKPTAQSSYREVYPLVMQPLTNTVDYRRFYYQLHQNVDRQIGRVLRQGKEAAGLREWYAAQDTRRSRNHPCTCGSGRKWKKCHAAPPSYKADGGAAS